MKVLGFFLFIVFTTLAVLAHMRSQARLRVAQRIDDQPFVAVGDQVAGLREWVAVEALEQHRETDATAGPF